MIASGRLLDVRKIAVLRANALGDYVVSLPALASLQAAYPTAEIVLLGQSWHARFLDEPVRRPGPVDRVVELPPVPGITAPPEAVTDQLAVRSFQHTLREERFDLAVQLHGGGRHSNPFLAGIGAGFTIGARTADAAPLDRSIPYSYYQPEVFRFLEVVRLVGAEAIGFEPELATTNADLAEAAPILEHLEGPVVVLHPGATDPRRRWPPERFAAVGDAVAARGASVVVTGTEGERPIVEAVTAAMTRPAVALPGALSIGGLAGLLSRCAVVVSNDTGPLHVARAVGTATVGLFWVGNLINAGPVTRLRHRPHLSWTIHCPACGTDCTRDLYPARGGADGCDHQDSFVADIPVDEVLPDVLDLLADAPERAIRDTVAESC